MINKYRKIFIPLGLFFCPLLVSHAGGVTGGLTERVQEVYRNTNQFQADFVQKTEIEILDRVVEEKGRVIFAKPGRFLIHYLGGRERKFISDGKKLLIDRPKEKEVEVIEQLGEVVSREALVFLGGLGEMTREFNVTEKGASELVLTPKSRSSPFRRLILKIDRETNLAREVTLFPKSGNKSHYLFSSIRLNERVPDSTFRTHP